MTAEELWLGLGGSCLAIIGGVVCLYGAQQQWRWLVDPPGPSLLKTIFGERFWLYQSYIAGAGLVFGGFIGLLRYASRLAEAMGH